MNNPGWNRRPSIVQIEWFGMTTRKGLRLPQKGNILLVTAMDSLKATQDVLFLGGIIAQAVLAAIIVCRRLGREFPVFLAYTVFHVFSFLGQYILHRCSYTGYFYCYWIGEAIDVVLALAVIREVFVHVFRSYGALERLGQLLFRWAVVVLIFLAVFTMASAPGADSDRLIAGLVDLERSVGIVKCGLLFFLFLFCRYFGLTWRNFAFGIAFGMGMMASVVAGAAALRAHVGQPGNLFYMLAAPAAYNIAVGIWISYALAPERQIAAFSLPPQDELNKWNQALARLLTR
jgi:hypothetical protein